LDLAHTLAGQPQLPPDLLERLGIGIAVHPVPQLDDLALAVGQRVDGRADRLLREADVHFLGRLGFLAGDQLAEARVPLAADRPVEARHRPRRSAHLLHVLERELGQVGDLFVGRVALELGDQLPLRPRDLLLAFDDVYGNADRARLVRHAALYGLADPPGGVRRELVAA